MKKINKILLSLTTIASMTAPISLVSCSKTYEKYRKEILEQISLIEDDKKEDKNNPDKVTTPSLINQLNLPHTEQLLQEVITRIRNNYVGSLDEKDLKEGLEELKKTIEIAKLIKEKVDSFLPQLELGKQKIDTLTEKDFEKVKEKLLLSYEKIRDSFSYKIYEVVQYLQTFPTNEEIQNKTKRPRSFDTAKEDLANILKDFNKENLERLKLFDEFIKLQKEYKNGKRYIKLIKDDLFKNEGYSQIYEVAYKFATEYISNSEKFEFSKVTELVKLLTENAAKIKAKADKYIKFSGYGFSFGKLKNIFDDKKGLIKKETFKSIIDKDENSEEYKKLVELKTKYNELLAKEFANFNELKKEVTNFYKELGNHLAKLFNIVFNKVKDDVIKKVTQKDIDLAINNFKSKDNYLASYSSDKGYRLGRSMFTLFDYKDTALKQFMEFAKTVIRISTRLENKGIDHANGANLTRYDETTKKLVVEFVLVNTLLSKSNDKKQTLVDNDANYEFELIKK